MKKGGLGKGLSELIPTKGSTAAAETSTSDTVGELSESGSVVGDARLATVSVEDISPNRHRREDERADLVNPGGWSAPTDSCPGDRGRL